MTGRVDFFIGYDVVPQNLESNDKLLSVKLPNIPPTSRSESWM